MPPPPVRPTAQPFRSSSPSRPASLRPPAKNLPTNGIRKLIASENYASPAVLLTMGTWLSDKYAEGTVGHRFYAGCQNVDDVESIAAEHAREPFGAPTPMCSRTRIDANLVAFWRSWPPDRRGPALASWASRTSTTSEAEWERLRGKLGSQRLMGMSLDAGGHLTTASVPTSPERCSSSAATAPTRRRA